MVRSSKAHRDLPGPANPLSFAHPQSADRSMAARVCEDVHKNLAKDPQNKSTDAARTTRGDTFNGGHHPCLTTSSAVSARMRTSNVKESSIAGRWSSCMSTARNCSMQSLQEAHVAKCFSLSARPFACSDVGQNPAPYLRATHNAPLSLPFVLGSEPHQRECFRKFPRSLPRFAESSRCHRFGF